MADNIIAKEAQIGKNVKIGHFTTVHPNVVILDDVTIDDNCIIGYPIERPLENRLLIIGSNSKIRSHSILYEGSKFESGLETGHHTLIRENSKAGSNLRVGSFSDIEGDCSFGDYVRCHSYVHVGKGSKIGNFVWIYSLVTLTNDPLPPSDLERPVVLEDGAVVCVGATVLPGTTMKKGAYASAGSVVNGEIPCGAVIGGKDSMIVGHVRNLINLETMTRHPWMKHFGHHYPAHTKERLQILYNEIFSSPIAATKA